MDVRTGVEKSGILQFSGKTGPTGKCLPEKSKIKEQRKATVGRIASAGSGMKNVHARKQDENLYQDYG